MYWEDEKGYNICKCDVYHSKKGSRYLLHAALRENMPSEVIQVLLHCDPEAATIFDELASLPIHIALEVKASKDILLDLIKIYPGCCRVKDQQGLLPLHIAAWNNAPFDVVSLLVLLYPEACCQLDYYSFTPLCLGAWNSCSYDTLSLLIRTNPHACKGKNTFGSLPLHSAVQDGVKSSNIALLLQQYPEGSKEVDLDDNLPIHILTHPDNVEEMSMERAKSLALLLKAYPESVHIATPHVPSPVEVFYSLRQYISHDIVRMVFNASPSYFKTDEPQYVNLYNELNWQARRPYVLLAARLARKKFRRLAGCNENCICNRRSLVTDNKRRSLAMLLNKVIINQRGNQQIRSDVFRYIMAYF